MTKCKCSVFLVVVGAMCEGAAQWLDYLTADQSHVQIPPVLAALQIKVTAK